MATKMEAGTGRHRRGGRREGAGRKPKGEKAGVPHVRRDELSSRIPVHVTVRVLKGIPNLRSRKAKKVVSFALKIACDRLGMRIIQFSIQANHLHLIVEAEDRIALTRAMKGLAVRIARRLNRAFGRKGKVFADRYHAHLLRTPREVRNAVRYVMENSRIHALRRGEILRHAVDPYAGGPCSIRFSRSSRALVVEPRSFLLRHAWKLPWIRRAIAVPVPEPAVPPLEGDGAVGRPRHAWLVKETARVRYAA